jgi:hypothetical protein
MPEGNRVAQALAACPLVIVSDVMAALGRQQNVSKRAGIGLRHHVRHNHQRTGRQRLRQAIATGEVKAVWIMGTNPAVSMPEGNRVAQALAARISTHNPDRFNFAGGDSLKQIHHRQAGLTGDSRGFR